MSDVSNVFDPTQVNIRRFEREKKSFMVLFFCDAQRGQAPTEKGIIIELVSPLYSCLTQNIYRKKAKEKDNERQLICRWSVSLCSYKEGKV